MDITVRESKEEQARRITVSYDFGAEVGDLVKLFGPEVVFNAAVDALSRDIRQIVRARLVAGDPDESIHEAVAKWKPGTRTNNQKVARLFKMLGQCSSADLREVQEILAGELPSAA